DLDALIREAGGSAFVFAISSGAALALEAAASRLNVKKLALYEPPFMVGNPAHVPPVDHQTQLVRLIAEGRRGDAVKYYMKDIIGMPGLLVTVFRFLPMWPKLKAAAPSLPYDSAVMGDFSLPASRAALLKLPTLVISGDKSMPVLRQAAQRLAEVIPGAQLRTLVGQTHNVAAGTMAPVLTEFFASRKSLPRCPPTSERSHPPRGPRPRSCARRSRPPRPRRPRSSATGSRCSSTTACWWATLRSRITAASS